MQARRFQHAGFRQRPGVGAADSTYLAPATLAKLAAGQPVTKEEMAAAESVATVEEPWYGDIDLGKITTSLLEAGASFGSLVYATEAARKQARAERQATMAALAAQAQAARGGPAGYVAGPGLGALTLPILIGGGILLILLLRRR